MVLINVIANDNTCIFVWKLQWQ